MRILYALDSYRPNIDGVAIAIERQASFLAEWGHQVAIIAPSLCLSNYQEDQGALHIYRVRAMTVIVPRWRMTLLPGPQVAKILDSFQPEVVVVSVPFPLTWAVARAAKYRDVPLVGIPGTMPEWLLSNFKVLKPVRDMIYPKLWEGLTAFYNQCGAVVGVTPTALEFLRVHGLKRPGFVISNGVRLDEFRPRPRDGVLAARLGVPHKPTVLYTGRLDAEKAMDAWVKAIPHVLAEVDAHFVIGGDGSERQKLEELVERLGVKSAVTFTGFLNTEDYARVYSLADVFAIASPAELQSIVTLEAAASGLPIVAVNAGALPELVEYSKNGYLFAEDDSTMMAANIVRLLRDRELRGRMGRASRLVAEQHNIQLTVKQYERLYLAIRDDRLSEQELSNLPVAAGRPAASSATPTPVLPVSKPARLDRGYDRLHPESSACSQTDRACRSPRWTS